MDVLERFRIAVRPYAIRQAADGNKNALVYILRDFIRDAKQGRARVVADVLERILAGESIGKILGTPAKRGRPRKYKSAILVHAMVRHLMLLRSQRPGRMQRRGEDAQAAVAEALEMSLNTVQKNYKKVQGLIKTIKDNPDVFVLERSGFAPVEQVYLTDPENAWGRLAVVRELLRDGKVRRRDAEKALLLLNIDKAKIFRKPLAPSLR